ncbi:MAG TPA: DUF4097 family beta strand repeat-containing protein [Candidatus Tumulicola sp.]|jgi:DUF4097 and DUF4098 domain-containing protein YvlB
MTAAGIVRSVALPLLVLLGACAFGSEVREQVHQVVQTGAAPLVRIANAAGSIRIATSEGTTVDVKATKSANSVDALHAMKVDVHAQDGGVSIATTYSGGLQQGGVSYIVTVPAGASLDVRNGAGSVDVTGVRGNVTIATQAGSVSADLATIAAKRSVTLSATTGTIRLAMRADSSARVRARSTIGSFSSDFPSVAGSQANVVGTNADGTIGSGSATISLSATTGSITLERI